MRRKFFSAAIAFISFCTCSFSQDSTAWVVPIPVHALRLSPFHVMNFYPTLQVAYERKVGVQSTIQFDVGCLLPDRDSENSKFHHKRGVKLKTEWRYYYGEHVKRTILFYAAVEGYYNRINFNRTRSVTECFDIDCNQMFIRWYPSYKVKYREPGLNLKWGFVKYYSKVLFDINMGLSYRYIIYKEPDYVPQATFGLDDETGWFGFEPSEETRTTVSPVLGVRFGYRIK